VRPSREKLDFTVYFRALGVFARNPTVIVLPLLAGFAGVLVSQFNSASGDGIISSITIFIVLLLQLFALGVSVIIADAGWRNSKASFDDAWQDARRKSRDILFAAFGLAFILNIARYAGQIIGSGAISIILLAIAVYGLIYTIPAASIGGIPGGGSISVSIDRVRGAPMTAALLTVVTLVLFFYASGAITLALLSLFNIESTLITALIEKTVQAVLTGYVAIVMAKVYTDVSFTAPRW